MIGNTQYTYVVKETKYLNMASQEIGGEMQ